MARSGRAILAVVAGAAVWAALWIGGTRAASAAFPSAIPDGQPVTSTAALVGLIFYSLPLSALAGYVTTLIARDNSRPVVWGLAVLQLVLGIIAETSAWGMAPVWYHLVFLALLMPATLFGGRVAAQRHASRVIARA